MCFYHAEHGATQLSLATRVAICDNSFWPPLCWGFGTIRRISISVPKVSPFVTAPCYKSLSVQDKRFCDVTKLPDFRSEQLRTASQSIPVVKDRRALALQYRIERSESRGQMRELFLVACENLSGVREEIR